MTASKTRARLFLALAAATGLLFLVCILARSRRTIEVDNPKSRAPATFHRSEVDQQHLDPATGGMAPAIGSLRTAIDHASIGGERSRTILHGRVIDQQGTPVADADLWLVTPRPRREGHTNEPYLDYGDKDRVITTLHADQDGAFRGGPVGPGEYWMGLPPLHLSRNKHQPEDISTLAQSVSVAGDQDEQEVTLRVFRGIYVRGHVLTPSGDAAASCIVIATLPSGVDLLQASTDENGVFAAGPLSPGRYSLQAHNPGKYVESEALDAEAGEGELILKLVQGGTIESYLVDKETRRRVEGEVTAYLRETGEAHPVSGSSDGYFREEGIRPGLYDLRAETSDGRIGVLTGLRVETGDNVRPVTIEVAPGAALILDRGGRSEPESCDIYDGEALIGSEYLPERESTRFIVPEGAIQIRYRVGNRARTTNVIAVVGGEYRVTLD